MPPADDIESTVALVLEHGLRPDQRTAKAFVAASHLKRLTLSDYQQRIEVLRMFGYAPAGIPIDGFQAGLKTTMLPKLAFVAEHACACCLCF